MKFWFKFDKEKHRRKFIEKHNNKVLKKLRSGKIKVAKILILLPHCLQNSDCLFKITWDKLDNCRRCGKCTINDFLKLKDDLKNIEINVVTGGTAARQIIIEQKPDIIIAVACENDLVSGIKDVDKIPVLAILNQRPFGPCRNTMVDMKIVREYVNHISLYKTL